MIKHSKYYYEKNRNMSNDSESKLVTQVIKENENEEDCGCGEGEMPEQTYLPPPPDPRVPEYYQGKYGYQARFVIDNFDLNYHIGTAVSYLLRSDRKHKEPIECIRKAIAHLQFEIERYERENN